LIVGITGNKSPDLFQHESSFENCSDSSRKMAVIACSSNEHFQEQLRAAKDKLIVTYFTAKWLVNYILFSWLKLRSFLELSRYESCKKITPLFEKLPEKYPDAVFLKVDVDICEDTAMGQKITAMPTFVFLRKRTKFDELQGANGRPNKAAL
jgi:thiol-disulfide isomerase/thioredoxin